MSSRRPSLEELVRDARAERTPDVDWDKVEGPLMARVEREARSRAAIEAYQGRTRGWAVAGLALAAAAAIPFFLARGSNERAASFDDMTSAPRDPIAGSLAWKEAAASLQVTHDGVAHDATTGEAIARADVLEAHHGRVVLTRTEPSGVTWSLEDNTRASVRTTRGTLVLALERGAVEAQVAPVANGEAFAIDVDGARVAVHGTHLRVARDGTRAIIDLREGVVSIGAPPAHGSTYGDLITAPAHVEFDASDPHGTLKVSHEPSRVRAATALERPPEPARPEGASPPVAPKPPVTPVPAVAPAHVAASPAQASPVIARPVPAPPTPPQADPDPEKTITDAVHRCVRARVGQTTGVIVTVSTHVEIQVADTGMVSTAHFDPPLAPEVQECAAQTIYRTRFSAPGALSILVDVTP